MRTRLAESHVSSGVKTYARCMFELLDVLTARRCAALQDPLAISGLVGAVRTDAQREMAFRSISASREHALKALHAEQLGRTSEALAQWNIVFNGNFPA